jgi:VAD1 Analog of StAR-related lipid transfer domain
MLVTKIVITHVAKTKCKLAIYTRVEWSKAPAFSKGLVERQALDDLDLDAMDLADVISDQVRKLGSQSRTKKAIRVFGHVGQQTSVSLFSAGESGLSKRPLIKQRTLTSMVFETTSSFAESVASSLMMWAFAALKTIWSVCSANTIILSLLALSMLANLVLSGKDTSEWWNERRAAKFMNRIGVGPNLLMSKAVYIKDLDEVLRVPPAEALGQSGSKW